MLQDSKDTNEFSENELLDIMYNKCDKSNTASGEVLASSIMQYLQTLTAQSGEEDKLASLRQLLDPDLQDPHVSRETFQSAMRMWIAQCREDSSDVISLSQSDYSEVSVNASATATEGHYCFCENKDLSDVVADLQQARHHLSEQNSSLLRMLAQCEDENLQLSLEITELQTKLLRSAIKAQSVTEKLEETCQMLKEVQETSSHTQTSFTQLTNETDRLRFHIRVLEDKNERLSSERAYAEEHVNKLKRANTELSAEHVETLALVMLKHKEITRKNILLDKMKNFHAENHKMTEGLLSELRRLEEHSHQQLLRFDRHCVTPLSSHGLNPPNQRSLQNMQQLHRVQGSNSVPVANSHREDIQDVLHKTKSDEIVHHLHRKDRPFPFRQQQQAALRQKLCKVHRDPNLHRSVWEEKGEKHKKKQKAWEKEQKHSQTGNQSQEAKKVVEVKLEEEVATCREQATVLLEHTETHTKLLLTEDDISDMKKQVCHLHTSLKSGQGCAELTSQVPHIHKGDDTEGQEEGTTVEKVLRVQGDSAIVLKPEEISASESKQPEPQVDRSGLLLTLGRIEAMVSSALGTAELVRQSERRVSQVREKMESITQKMEQALDRAADTEEPIEVREKRPSQSPGLTLPANCETGTINFIDDVGPEQKDITQILSSSPVFPEVSEPPQLPMNGAAGRGSCWELQQEKKLFLPEFSLKKGDGNLRASSSPLTFPFTRSRPSLAPIMPTLPEEEEDSPEELDSSSSSPRTSTVGESQAVILTAPTIVYPQKAVIVQQEGRYLEHARPHSPRARQARNSSGRPITTVDSTGNVIDLVKDQLPELQLSEEDRQKNLELLEQAKMVSDRFLTRRGRRSISSLTDSPTALSPSPTPSSSPRSSRSSSFIGPPQTAAGTTEATHGCPQSVSQHLEVPTGREQLDLKNKDQEDEPSVDYKPVEKRKVSSGTLTPRFAVQKENRDLTRPRSPQAVSKADEISGRNPNLTPATGVAKPVPRPPTQQAPCTAEIKTIGAFPPLMRAVSWDSVGSINSRTGASGFPPTVDEVFSDKPRDGVFKSSLYKDLQAQPGSIQKLSKLREEHKLMRNQSIVSSKLPELSEAAEQEKGPPSSAKTTSSEEMKEKSDAMPNISDVMLRKLKLHRGLPGCAPPLSEKEVENAFVQLSLAFRNDNYTLETRLKQAERERNLTEEDTEKELEEFKGALKMTAPQWQNMEQREAYQRLIETLAVLYRLTTRLSSRAEIVGAVRQEKRMNKATEVMMQYVENLKRTYEKDHAELMEFKKLANQNSNRCYGAAVDTGDDGVARSSRSMSLTLGKALPRRRVSVAVVPKFNLLNIPGQSPGALGPGPNVGLTAGAALPVLCEANDVKSSSSTEAVQPTPECGKSGMEPESEPAKPPVNLEELRAEIRAEIKAKIEEEAYNKGYQEGLKHTKALLEEKHAEEMEAEKLLELKHKDEESGKRRMEEILVLLSRFCPSISVSRRLLWVVLVLFVVMCVLISIFTFFSDYYNRREDT
ncbi:protein MRVI1 isoform X2 [Xiphophorus hellerii]|uniref:protein MRVI1 isoform X2 n=1 Tax=Xiphophorus hellerii TaxID=8084 RepID=UPI0013B447A0|nr:protein MRVI1 isoform X2 [Xiphophorus hellerii]